MVVSLFLNDLYFTCALCVLLLRKCLYNVLFVLQAFRNPFVNQGFPSLFSLVTFFNGSVCHTLLSIHPETYHKSCQHPFHSLCFPNPLMIGHFLTDAMLSLSNCHTSLRLLLNCLFMQEYLQITKTGKGSRMSFISRPLGRVTAVKDKDGALLTGDDEVKDIWLGYFDDLLNVENVREDLEGILPVQGPIEEIYIEEVITQLEKMKKNKACGPDYLPIEVAKAHGDEGAIWMTVMLNEAMREGIPEEWRTSTITPIYKQKGDHLECNNARGITLLSHTLKLWERVVESRLRKTVNISEGQHGFQPGKSTI